MTSGIPTAISFLDAVTGHVENGRTTSADRPIRLAVVDPSYNPFASYPDPVPAARVTFEGESTLSGKAYAVAQGFIPRAGQRVWMVPIGTTYLISGAVNNQTPQGFWQDANGVDSGVELGGGSYFDTTEGLYLETDLTVLGVGAYWLVRKSSATGRQNTTTHTNDPHLQTFLEAGLWECHAYLFFTGTTGGFAASWLFSGSWSGQRAGMGPGPFTYDTTTVDATVLRDSAALRSGGHNLNTSIAYGVNHATNYYAAHEFGLVDVSAAGTWGLAWAQRTSDAATTTLHTASFITARRVG